MKKFWGSRIGLASICLLICAGGTVLFGGFFSLLMGDFIEACKGVFWFFTAPMVVSAALAVLTNIKDKFVGGFGIGIYYGTAILYGIPKELGWVIPKFDRLFVGSAISCLVAYFVYQKLPHD